MRFSATLLCLALAAATPSVAAVRWTINGPDGGSVKRFAFDPDDSSIVYAAATNGLFRSSDGGRHWSGAPLLLGMSVGDVAVAKHDPRIVFAASPYGLFKSSDRGVSWTMLSDTGSFGLAVGAQNADIVYDNSIFGPVRSTDGGVTFGSKGSGLPSGVTSAIAVDPRDATVAYVAYASSAGVYKSTDSGAHWTQANSGLATPQVFALAIDDGGTLYAGGNGSTLFKSTDGAASWTPVPTGQSELTYSDIRIGQAANILAATTHGVLRSTDGGATWSRGADIAVAAVALDPVNSATFLAASSVHVLRTIDGGATTTIAESGLTSFATRAIAADPHDDAIVYAGGPAGVARSNDHGRTWTLLSSTFQPTRIVIDANASTLYAISDNVYRSVDGITWNAIGGGLPAHVAPQYLAADSGTLYAVVNGDVYKKIGDGDWFKANDGSPGSMDFVVIDPRVSSTLYTGGPFGLFKSVDGASHWTAVNNGLTGLNAFGMAVDPFDSLHLFAWSSSGVFTSADGGANWTADASGVRGDRFFDPVNRGLVYAHNFNDVKRSADGGSTWYSLSDGLPRSHSLFALGAHGTPYLGDFSGGVFVMNVVRTRAAPH